MLNAEHLSSTRLFLQNTHVDIDARVRKLATQIIAHWLELRAPVVVAELHDREVGGVRILYKRLEPLLLVLMVLSRL